MKLETNLKRRTFLGILAGTAAYLSLPHFSFADEKLYTPRKIPDDKKEQHKKMIDVLDSIPLNYRYGKFDLEDRISDMRIWGVDKGDYIKTVFENYFIFEPLSGNCFELTAVETGKLFRRFMKEGLLNDYDIDIVTGFEPRYFDGKIKNFTHDFIRITNRKGDVFYRDPSFNIALEYAPDSEYKVKFTKLNINGQSVNCNKNLEIKGQKSFMPLGVTDDHELLMFSGYSQSQGYMGLLKIKDNIEVFPLTPKNIYGKIKGKSLSNICLDLIKRKPLMVEEKYIHPKNHVLIFRY